MRKTNIGAWAATLALAAVGFMPLAPAFSAQAQNQMPSAQQQQNQPQTRTYLGEIVKTQSGKYGLLTDKKSGKGYFLDNQEDAKKFDQQTVLVTGTIDPQTNTLHVNNIKPAPHQ